MAKKIKWQIKNLTNSKQLNKTAKIILKSRIESLLASVEKYLQNNSVKYLHEVRIALRRVRYSMELFFVCYNKKDFIRFYNKVQKLQDLSGFTRDIDITIENVNSLLVENSIKIDTNFIQNIQSKKAILQDQFNNELKKFINGKSFKDFYKQNF